MTTTFAPTTWDGTLRISTPFGQIDALHKTPHSGVDVITAGPCYAPFAGTVQRSMANGNSGGGLGNYFQLVSDDGRFVFIVGHGNANSDTGLREGQHVSERQEIMRDMGRPTTGYSTGPHYHEELTDHGKLVDFLDYLGKTFDGSGSSAAPGVVSGWQVGQTDFQGTYGENDLNGAKWYCIEPDTSNDKTIWAVAQRYGLGLAQVSAWTAKVSASKWAGQLLQAGSSWWDGSDTYYAGVCIALNDVAAELDAYESTQLAAQTDAATAAQTARAAVVVEPTEHTDDAAPIVANPIPAPAPDPTPAPKVVPLTPAQLAAYAAELHDLPVGQDANTTTALSGLLAGNPVARKRAYYAYAGSALLISFGPDIITAGILTGDQTPVFVGAITLATSILLKIGVAFGFVAASNTSSK